MLIDRSFSHLVSSDGAASAGNERRAFLRVPAEVDVTIVEGERVVTCVSRNFSVGGFRVSTYAPFIAGASVRFRFQLPTGVVVGTGTVRWVREGTPGCLPSMGIEVANMGVADRECLVRFCLRRCA